MPAQCKAACRSTAFRKRRWREGGRGVGCVAGGRVAVQGGTKTSGAGPHPCHALPLLHLVEVCRLENEHICETGGQQPEGSWHGVEACCLVASSSSETGSMPSICFSSRAAEAPWRPGSSQSVFGARFHLQGHLEAGSEANGFKEKRAGAPELAGNPNLPPHPAPGVWNT